jgi:hypothetical protein
MELKRRAENGGAPRGNANRKKGGDRVRDRSSGSLIASRQEQPVDDFRRKGHLKNQELDKNWWTFQTEGKKEGNIMKSRGMITIVAVLVSLLLMAGSGLAGETVISGKVTADNQLLSDDGQVYEVSDTENGNQLLEHMEKKVAVKGTVAEKDGKKMITVTSFKVLK